MELSTTFVNMEAFIKGLQNKICEGLEIFEPVERFQQDVWQREQGGGGWTRILSRGKTFAKAGVNISSIHGEMTNELARHLCVEQGFFGACGLSLVIHPNSPRVPTVHMNVRYFETDQGRSWFGGGTDLTPYYPYPKDFKEFHLSLQDACDSVILGSYQQFKETCDQYFKIRHRSEMRGIGGVFFDYLDGREPTHAELVRSIGEAFLRAYSPIVERRKNESFEDSDVIFQKVRRGRYVEFNLIYDRGTLFGLRSGGRIESIFMSLPPEVEFHYNWQPEPGSPQEEMLSYFQPYDWING
jgi:coproporphyrinogen III oxidase